jgi:L-alanine-DL-glutamate epimerase-like enolase superfamily enzyme
LTAPNLGRSAENAQVVYNTGYRPNASLELTKFAVVIRTDDGVQGEYVPQGDGTRATMAQTLSFAPNLLGRDPDERALIWSEMKRELRQRC